MQYVTLNNGVKMPLEGFGVFQVTNLDECEQSVLDAINAGYRLIDTALIYKNEKAVGKAIKRCGVPREELFITTKLWVSDSSYEAAKKAIETSLSNLGLEYIDLYLIHQPFGDIFGAWRAMEEAYQQGKLKALGVSNFYPDRLYDFYTHVNIKPAVNQVELHPFFAQEGALKVMRECNVVPEAWGPFAEGKSGFFTNEVLSSIAKKYNKTIAQVALRWNVQRGVVVIPKSVHKERIVENFNIWDFELSPEDMDKISALDKGYSEICDHRSVDFQNLLYSLSKNCSG